MWRSIKGLKDFDNLNMQTNDVRLKNKIEPISMLDNYLRVEKLTTTRHLRLGPNWSLCYMRPSANARKTIRGLSTGLGSTQYSNHHRKAESL
ncbi:MAG: hypothetical protein V3V00_06665 [Saprospiraceae bacterium]